MQCIGISLEITFFPFKIVVKTEHLPSDGPGAPREANYDGKISAQAQISSYQICLKYNFPLPPPDREEIESANFLIV